MKIPKNLRRIGDKALAGPKVAGIVSGALVPMGALVAGREVVQEVTGGGSVTKALRHGPAVSGVSGVVQRAFEEILEARHHDRHASGKGDKGRKARHPALYHTNSG